MRYIVNTKEVTRDTFYFCQKAKEENKTFVLLSSDTYPDSYINNYPEYDFYICVDTKTFYTKGEKNVSKWFVKYYYSGSRCSIEDMQKRYNKSKFKDTMTFEEWYSKNGWKLKIESEYEIKRYDILKAEDFEENGVKTKLFSVKVKNVDTVKTLNKIKDEFGDCVEFVLRDFGNTEIIYKECYKEI